MKKIRKNLDDSMDIMHGNFRKLMERGEELDRIEMNGDALLESSEEFVKKVVPWYKRLNVYAFCSYCFPSWWFSHRLSPKWKASPEQTVDQVVISLE